MLNEKKCSTSKTIIPCTWVGGWGCEGVERVLLYITHLTSMAFVGCVSKNLEENELSKIAFVRQT